jgi:hypothetical protein
MDSFARQTAMQAHNRIADLTNEIARLEKQLAQRTGFANRCHLCGDPCRKSSRYCHAHSWAEGT